MNLRFVDPAQSEALGASLGSLVTRALSENAEECAFRFGGTSLSRGSLLNLAEQVSKRLQSHGLSPGEPVLVEVAHSFDLVVALCGVLTAGGCAVPVDPDVLQARQKAIIADIAPRLIIRKTSNQNSAQIGGSLSIVCTKRAAPSADRNLAFVVYTSGSTGGPKGVQISHESYTKRMIEVITAHPPAADVIDLAWTPSSFIGMLDEIFYPILSGRTSIIAEPSYRADPRALASLIDAEGVTSLRITPSLLHVFLQSDLSEKLSSLRAVYCSGETLSPEIQRLAHQVLKADLFGFYGATEAPGVGVHRFEREAAPLATTICNPQPFAPMRVVTPTGSEALEGVEGELWVGGCAVANGYHNNPCLSAKKFIREGGTSWYRTGDLARRLKDGRIEILGRADQTEVNISGVRINLPEIREAMLSIDDVSQAWVSATESRSGAMLVGHYVLDTDAAVDDNTVLSALAERLPPASVPRVLLNHTGFPLMANGKLDIRMLARLAQERVESLRSASVSEAPTKSNDLSAEASALLPSILELAQKILGVPELSGHDNFFLKGGNSLVAVQYALALSERVGVELATTLVFNTGSFIEIAERIAKGEFHLNSAVRLLQEGAEDEEPLYSINASGNYAMLAQRLPNSRPLFNLNIFGLTQEVYDKGTNLTLTDLAEGFATQIINSNPKPRLSLLAYCQDGCLAIETARILQERANIECRLLLIDTFFTEHRVTAKMMLMRSLDVGPSYYFGKLMSRFGGRKKPVPFAEMSPEKRAALMEKSKKDRVLYQRYTDLFMRYEPEPYDGPVTIFISSEWRRANLSCVKKLAGERLQIRHVQGLHDALFSEQKIGQLAVGIETEMSSPQSEPLN